MEYGIVQASFIPVRKEAYSSSEMTSQLLFGEIFEVVERKDQWLLVRNNYDGYEGWISPGMTSLFDEKTLREYEAMEFSLVREKFSALRGDEGTMLITTGSVLYFHAGNTRHILCGKTYELDKDPAPPPNGQTESPGKPEGGIA